MKSAREWQYARTFDRSYLSSANLFWLFLSPCLFAVCHAHFIIQLSFVSYFLPLTLVEVWLFYFHLWDKLERTHNAHTNAESWIRRRRRRQLRDQVSQLQFVSIGSHFLLSPLPVLDLILPLTFHDVFRVPSTPKVNSDSVFKSINRTEKRNKILRQQKLCLFFSTLFSFCFPPPTHPVTLFFPSPSLTIFAARLVKPSQPTYICDAKKCLHALFVVILFSLRMLVSWNTR